MCYLFLAKQVACENGWINGNIPAEIGEGNDCVYVKGFIISYIDEEGEITEWDYYSEDFVYDAEYNPNPLKFEIYYSVEGLRATEVDAF